MNDGVFIANYFYNYYFLLNDSVTTYDLLFIS